MTSLWNIMTYKPYKFKPINTKDDEKLLVILPSGQVKIEFDRFFLHWSCSPSTSYAAVKSLSTGDRLSGSNSNAGKMDQTWFSQSWWYPLKALTAIAGRTNPTWLAVWELRHASFSQIKDEAFISSPSLLKLTRRQIYDTCTLHRPFQLWESNFRAVSISLWVDFLGR